MRLLALAIMVDNMRNFLENGPLWIHPTAYMPLRVFFDHYHHFCVETYGEEIKGVRYKNIWNEFGLSMTRKMHKPYPLGSDMNYYGRFIMGIREPGTETDSMDQIKMQNDMLIKH